MHSLFRKRKWRVCIVGATRLIDKLVNWITFTACPYIPVGARRKCVHTTPCHKHVLHMSSQTKIRPVHVWLVDIDILLHHKNKPHLAYCKDLSISPSTGIKHTNRTNGKLMIKAQLVRLPIVEPAHPGSSPQLGTGACIFLNLNLFQNLSGAILPVVGGMATRRLWWLSQSWGSAGSDVLIGIGLCELVYERMRLYCVLQNKHTNK